MPGVCPSCGDHLYLSGLGISTIPGAFHARVFVQPDQEGGSIDRLRWRRGYMGQLLAGVAGRGHGPGRLRKHALHEQQRIPVLGRRLDFAFTFAWPDHLRHRYFQDTNDVRFSAKSPGLGPSPVPLLGKGSDHAIFSKIAMPLGEGVSVGVLLSHETSQFYAVPSELLCELPQRRFYDTTEPIRRCESKTPRPLYAHFSAIDAQYLHSLFASLIPMRARNNVRMPTSALASCVHTNPNFYANLTRGQEAAK